MFNKFLWKLTINVRASFNTVVLACNEKTLHLYAPTVLTFPSVIETCK